MIKNNQVNTRKLFYSIKEQKKNRHLECSHVFKNFGFMPTARYVRRRITYIALQIVDCLLLNYKRNNKVVGFYFHILKKDNGESLV